MTLFMLIFGVFALAMAGLAIGLFVGREPLKGSCGGDAVVRACPLCSAPEQKP